MGIWRRYDPPGRRFYHASFVDSVIQRIVAVLTNEATPNRLAVSLLANGVRALLMFAGVLLLARFLGPERYGTLTFLIASFVAIRTYIEMGTHNAFGSFVSQGPQPCQHFLFYGVWLLVQPLILAALVLWVLPSNMFDGFWPEIPAHLVVLGLFGTFMSEQVRLFLIQVAEAFRKTAFIQGLIVAQLFVHATLILILAQTELLSVRSVLWLLIGEFALLAVVCFPRMHQWITESDRQWRREHVGEVFSLAGLVRRYRVYCTPLVLGTYLGGTRIFAARWIVQNYAGPVEQSYFSVANQIAMIGLVGTTSVLKVFWKEVAEAFGRGDASMMRRQYMGITALVVLASSVLCAAVMPWSSEIMRVFFGEEYAAAGPVLGVMVVFTIFVSMQQIGGTFLLATEQTLGDRLALSYSTSSASPSHTSSSLGIPRCYRAWRWEVWGSPSHRLSQRR